MEYDWGIVSNTSKYRGGLSSCTDLVVIAKDAFGVAYLPEWNFNGIGDMLPGQGYQIKMLYEARISFE